MDAMPSLFLPPAWSAVLLAVLLSACATPQVQHVGEARVSPRLFDDHVRMADGARLPLSAWLPVGETRGVALSLHGFNDYRRAFEETGAYLSSRGYAVYAYDQRGFGETEQTGVWPGKDRLADDLRAVLALLRARHPGRPLFLIGESMGGAVALHALGGSDPPRLDGLVLIAPAVWGRSTMPLLQRGVLWLAAHSFPATRLSPRGLNLRATDNDEALRRLREDPLVIKDTRVDALWGVADLMDRALATGLSDGVATLILYGARDQIIPKRPTCLWLAGLPSGKDRRLAVYPQGWHMLTRDLQAGTVLEDIAAWLADDGAILPSGAEVPGGRPDFCPGRE